MGDDGSPSRPAILSYETRAKRPVRRLPQPPTTPTAAVIVLTTAALVWAARMWLDGQMRTPSYRTTNVGAAQYSITALERFRAAKGIYPAELQQLQPQFLDMLPTDRDAPGTAWQYQLSSDASSYRLTWQLGGLMCVYDSRSNQVTEFEPAAPMLAGDAE